VTLISPSRRAKLWALDGLLPTEAEGLLLAKLAAQVDPDLAIVELGSYRGKSTCYLAEGARRGRGAKVYAFDPWDLPRGDVPDVYAERYHTSENQQIINAQVTAMGLQDHVQATRALSHDAARLWEQPIGLLHVDGDHSYAGVRGDYCLWARYVVVGGYIAFHDYSKKHKGVVRVVREARKDRGWVGWDFGTKRYAVARRI